MKLSYVSDQTEKKLFLKVVGNENLGGSGSTVLFNVIYGTATLQKEPKNFFIRLNKCFASWSGSALTNGSRFGSGTGFTLKTAAKKYFFLLDDRRSGSGAGSGSVPRTIGSGRPKNLRIQIRHRIRTRNSDFWSWKCLQIPRSGPRCRQCGSV